MQMKLSLVAAAVAFCAAVPAQAAIATFTGTTMGGPTFNRPLEDLSGVSAVGTATSLNAYIFNVSVSGEYSFLTTAGFDSFAVLYSAPFNRTTPLTGAVQANDDLVSFTTSGFAQNLTAGTTYTYVVTGFGNTDMGAFSTTIGGPGMITQVPEPAAYALFLMGLGGVALAKRRARRDEAVAA